MLLSNSDTGKTALLVESSRVREVKQTLEKFGAALHKIKT
jgi:uncharacterized protein with GYD domain